MRKFAVLLSILLVVTMLFTTACFTTNTLSALVTTLGNAAAAIAQQQGNTNLAVKLKADTAAASAAILAWKKGTSSQMVLQVLNVVMDDLNLVPYVGPYTALIDIAIVTAEEIIAEINAASPPATALKASGPRRHATMAGKTPKNRASFVKAWNKVASGNPTLLQLQLQ